MARGPKVPKDARRVDALKHDAATRKNIPTAEMESFFRRDEDSAPMPPASYPRARPLREGLTRTAEEPSTPELIWNGARIAITDAQRAELAETGRLTLGDAQLVWRGKDQQDWSDLVVQGAAALHPGEGPPQGDHRRPEAPLPSAERARPG